VDRTAQYSFRNRLSTVSRYVSSTALPLYSAGEFQVVRNISSVHTRSVVDKLLLGVTVSYMVVFRLVTAGVTIACSLSYNEPYNRKKNCSRLAHSPLSLS